jgi:hypothetical protein
MARYVTGHPMGADFLWLADEQLGVHRLLYVDKWHYNPDFSREIAGRLADFLNK